MIELAQSPVIFDEPNHKYYYNEQELSGITAILSKYLFPKKYDNVPPAILEKAKERGSAVHEQLEELFLWGKVAFGEPRPEVLAYQQLAEEKQFHQIAAEYLVSDLTYGVASKIDGILEAGTGVVDICDYKTTAQIDKAYLSWQLSIYAYLLEKQCAGVYVRNLYGIHLRGDKARCVEIKRLPDFAVQQLLTAFALGTETFANPMDGS